MRFDMIVLGMPSEGAVVDDDKEHSRAPLLLNISPSPEEKTRRVDPMGFQLLLLLVVDSEGESLLGVIVMNCLSNFSFAQNQQKSIRFLSH